MRKFIAAMAIVMFSATAFASQTTINTEGLSDAQIAEIKSIAASKVAESAKAPGMAETMTLAATWGQQAAIAAEGFAKAMGIAAKELNVSINEFLDTDAGKITAALIIWKVAGESLLGIIYGGFFVIVGLSLARVISMRLFTKEYVSVEYSRFGGFFKGTKMVRIPKNISELRTEGEWLVLWLTVVITLGTLGIAGIIIL